MSTWLLMLWHRGMSLRFVVGLVILAAVTAPAVTLLSVGQRLSEESQQILLDRGELALMALGSFSIAEPLWIVDRAALNAAVERMLENPQVVAVKVQDTISNDFALEQVRPGYSMGSKTLDELTSLGLLSRRISPVTRSREQVGNLVVWFDANFGQAILQQRRNQMLLLVALQVALSMGVLIPILVARVIRPIERLKLQASAMVDPSGRQEQPQFVWKRQDELGLLGRHLSQVQDQLRTLFDELRAKNAQLEQMALYDGLTSLPNRSLFADLVQREILQARRNQKKFGVFFIDLDRFKAVNDSMGHAAGDVVLVETARRLSEVLREVDVVCRQSGDEFLVLLRDISHWEILGEMADRVIKTLEARVVVDTRYASVSASIGISLFPDDAQDFETLIKNADVAMYQAKKLGRSRYSFFHTDLNARILASMELEQQLAFAIDHGELVLHYQPQVDAQTGSLVGLEALMRWQHPQKGLLYPASFIGLAEESGKIAEMGAWALKEASRQLAQWKARGLHVGCMAVNVSALEFRDHRLIDTLQMVISEYKLKPGDLEIEITESVLMMETDTSQRIIQHIRDLGVGISIDDFGTGYSSLSYLKRLRPDQLKIDRSFVCDIENDADFRAIVKGIVSLANELGLSVVAEGVETPQQARILREAGCRSLQGYVISKPLSSSALEAWLTSRPDQRISSEASQIVG